MTNPKTILDVKPQSAALAWSAAVGETPAGPPLAAGEWLLLPTHQPGRAPAWSRLRWLGLDDGQPGKSLTFEGALISGLAAVPPQSSSEVSILLAAYSAEALGDKGALAALDSAEEVWRWSPGAAGVSAPALLNGMAWVTTNTGFLVSLDLATGAEGASLPLGATPSLSAPALTGEALYVPCRGPRLLAIGLDGQLRWRFEAADHPGSWLNQTPVILGERLFALLNRAGRVIALRLADGELAWQVQVGPADKDLSPPATDGEWLYLGARDGLHAFDPADGRELWCFPVERGLVAAPVVVGGAVYIAGRDHHLYALDAASGQELWRYEGGRRIEVPPLVTASPQPLAVVADQGGTIIALQRNLSAVEHEAAGNWVEAASAYAALGQLTRGAELLETHGEPFKAAQLWGAAGHLERAAGQYELAGAWQEAAELWGQLDRPLKQAEALEQHARSLSREEAGDETCAEAWDNAAQAFDEAGEPERAEACRLEVARCRRLPYLAVEVKHDALVLNTWTCLRLVVRNRGGGPARRLIIRARGGQFEGRVTETRQITTLRAGQTREDELDVRPLAVGDSVPLRVSIEYQDRAQTNHTWGKTLHLPVAQTKVIKEKLMTGIPPDIYKELRDALSDCDSFEGNRKLRDVFALATLKPWRNSLPQSDTLIGRVDAVISYLHDKHRSDGANVLVLLLKVLSQQIDPEDTRHQRLVELTGELERALGGGSPADRTSASTEPTGDQAPVLDAEITAEIERLVREDQLAEALEKLSGLEGYRHEAALLDQRLTRLRKQERRHTVTRDDAGAERTRIAEAILDLISSQ
jgi:outer membrane protein assembly factor BamB